MLQCDYWLFRRVEADGYLGAVGPLLRTGPDEIGCTALTRSVTITEVSVTKRRVIGYLRVSTTEQVNGFGLDVQENSILDYCKANQLRLVDLHTDQGQSGSNGLDTRVALAETLARLKAGEADALVVYRLDRLARDLILQETLVQRLSAQGTPVLSATEDVDTDSDDPTKVLIRHIVGAVSQYERAVIRGRMMAGRAAKAAAGGFIGGRPPYGFTVVNGEVVPDPAEQEVVQLVRQLASSGLSLRDIGAELDEKDYRPRTGKAWHPNTVRRILATSP
jgi:DNA invertase Pin-like site-specific DNA recombinase